MLELIEDLGLLAAIGADAVPGSPAAAAASLAGRIAAIMARNLKRLQDAGVNLDDLEVPSLDDLVAESIARRGV